MIFIDFCNLMLHTIYLFNNLKYNKVNYFDTIMVRAILCLIGSI